MATNRLTALFALLAFVIIILYYIPFIGNFFLYDDFRMIENLFSGIGATLLGYNTIRVVANLSFAPLYFISGFNPLAYNVFNITLHFVNSLLVFFFINYLFKSTTLSILTGIIFVASGVASDAIFWKISNATLLSLTFCLVTLILYIRWRQEHRRSFYLWSILTFFLGMFSKEDAATLPLLIIFIDLFFLDGWKEEKISVILRVVPYTIIVASYLLIAQILIWIFGINLEAFTVFFKFRPLYSLFGGYTVFFLHPAGYLDLWSPSIYITGVLILLSFFFVKERRLLWLGYGWIFISFIPSSLMSFGRFDAPYMVNSVSRYLYMPSVGSSIVFAVILSSFKVRFTNKVFSIVLAIFFIIYISTNYKMVHDRGEQRYGQGMLMERFLYSLREVQPTFPENSYVHVVNGPASRAYIQQSLRAFYGNPKIYWVDNPDNVVLKKEGSGFIIFHNYTSEKAVEVRRKM